MTNINEENSLELIVANVPLDRGSGIPIYVQIRDRLRELIQNQLLPRNVMLPSENSLAQHLSVSRMTIRQALSQLEQEGIIKRIQGIGTRVQYSGFKHEIKSLNSFTEDMLARGLVPSSKIIRVGEVHAPPEVAEVLKLTTEDQVELIHRIRLADGVAVGIHIAYLLPGLIDINALTPQDSLYALLEARGVSLEHAEETLQATAASADEANVLGVKEGGPLLAVRRVTYDTLNRPIEVVLAKYRPDLYQYTLTLRRKFQRKQAL